MLLFYAGRLLSVIMGVGIVFITFLCGREILDEAGAILSSLIAAMMVPLVYYSKTVNLEVPYIFWVVLSFLFFLRILKYHNLKDYLLFSTSAVCAVCTKDQAYGFYVLIPLFIVLSYHSSRRENGDKLRLIESLLDRRFLLSSVWALLLFLILHNVLFNADGFLSHFGLTTWILPRMAGFLCLSGWVDDGLLGQEEKRSPVVDLGTRNFLLHLLY
jgi:4-amino-4-deoxy-L-arabinose transferase-like glycosyltransferase